MMLRRALRSLSEQPGIQAVSSGLRWRCFGTRVTVMSFGDGSHGALGLPSTFREDAYEPSKVSGLPPDVIGVSAGHFHSLAVTSEGQVWAWGRDAEAQLGRGGPSPGESWNKPTRVRGLDHVKARDSSASGVVSAAIGNDGSLWVWGKSKRGQLGLGKDVIEALLPSRVEALSNEKIIQVSFGWGHALARTEDGKLFGWGYFADGRIGTIDGKAECSPLEKSEYVSRDGSPEEVAEKLVLEAMDKEKDMPILWEPRLLEELSDMKVRNIACGLDHSLVLGDNNAVYSGGSNIYGQLGRGNPELGLKPINLPSPVFIASGLGHSLAICQDRSSDTLKIASWGWNISSQLGRTGPQDIPEFIEELSEENPVSVAGGRAHSVCLTAKKEVWVWGSGRNGRLGTGSSCDEAEPVSLDDLEGVEVLRVACGLDHTLLLVLE
ncbi:hypothetical protein MLD38_003493 [Melastoma candidum]|uniref:Uncharacterized protein n=1 Tax=Melastoma candidum TaxID=119954 RepID=A0ACB9S1Z8_9MYRT|nr:hypothetical protein MLD38_003493 [Melastoma candidum]